MAALKYLLYIVLLIVAFIVAILFVRNNSAPVSLELLHWTSPAMALGSWILVGFVLGVLSIFIAISFNFFRMKAGNARLNRKLQAAETEIKRLKADFSESSS